MRYCRKCGAKLADTAKFCENCGEKVTTAQTPRSEKVSANVTLCPDGKYRWMYEFHMLRNPVILFTVLKVLMLGSCAPTLLVALATLGKGFSKALEAGAQVFGIMMVIMIPMGLLSYLILAGIYGWKYIVLFVMDEEGIEHIQQEKQFTKAQGIAWLTMLAGAAANQPGRVGGGMLMATKNSSSSTFRNVKSVVSLRSLHTIKVNSLFSKNQIYVEAADYDFVWNYITTRCPKAKIR